MIKQVIVPTFSLADVSGRPSIWHEAMQALVPVLAKAMANGAAGVALPASCIDSLAQADQHRIAAWLESRQMRLMPWLLWPLPLGLPFEALAPLGIGPEAVVASHWRRFQEEAGYDSPNPWVALPERQGHAPQWQLLPVQYGPVKAPLPTEAECPDWHLADVAEALLAPSGPLHANWRPGAWMRFTELLSGVGGPWRSRPLPGTWSDFLSRIPVPAPVEEHGCCATPKKSAEGSVTLDNTSASLRIGSGGNVHAAFKEGNVYRSLIDYRLQGPVSEMQNRGLAHRISLQPGGVGIRVRMPLPGAHHGHHPPVKLWTSIRLHPNAQLCIETRFEDLPAQMRLVMRVPTGHIGPHFTLTGAYGTVAGSRTGGHGDWLPSPLALQLKGRVHPLIVDLRGWPLFQLRSDGRATLELATGQSASHAGYRYSGRFSLSLNWDAHLR